MIKLRDDIKPSDDSISKLAGFQDEIDNQSSFEKCSAKAKELFPKKNKKDNKVFQDVKNCLTQLCNSTRRCVYCEDSFADEVEHIYPKDLFPEKCFHWENYVYACGPCNGPKNNKFAVFKKSDDTFTIVNPPKGTQARKPPAGEAAFINQRIDDPLKFAILDISATFKFYPLPGLNDRDKKKMDYTFNEVLRLNDAEREPIRQARANAFGNYKNRLIVYHTKKTTGAPKSQLDNMIDGIKKEGHSTVWKEMQRQHQNGMLKKFDTELDNLFIACPEALVW